MIEILFAILFSMISLWGAFAFLVGLASFFVLPGISAATDWKAPSDFMYWLARQPIRRAAIVVSEHNDIIFKPMSFLGIGLEKITIDGDEKLFEDPANRLHHWRGLPFALADEKHGVLFDPRDAATGKRKRDFDEHGESEFFPSDEEWEEHDITKWIPGFFEFPYQHEFVDLSLVRQLVDGGERSEYAKRVEELYKHSRDPFDDGTPITQFFYPIIGFAIPFFGIAILAEYILSSGTASGPSVGWSIVALLYLLADTDSTGHSDGDRGGRSWKKIIGMIFAVTIPVAIFGLIAVFISPILAVALAIAMALGFLLLPMLSFLFRPSEAATATFANLFFRLGFMGFDEPVFNWEPDGYTLREARTFDDPAVNPTWYTLFGSKVGFTFDPSPNSWGSELKTHAEVEGKKIETDGGKSNLPEKYQPTSYHRDKYGAFAPNRLKDDCYYLDTGIALNRFKNSAVGEKALKRLLEAKEKFGTDSGGMSDQSVLYLTAGSGLLGAIAGIILFLL